MVALEKRFLPFLLTQAFGAFNDNFFRNALVLLITFSFVEQLGSFSGSMVALSAAIFVIPFFLFSATAGRMADRFDKARLIRWLKCSEFLIMLMAALGFWLMNLWLLLGVLFFMGAQSALFGPVKYAIMPQLVSRDHLMSANAWVEASTFIVILAGTIISSLLMLTEHGRVLVSLGCVGIAAMGYGTSYFIPALPARSDRVRIRLNILHDTFATLWFGLKQKNMRYPMLGIGWFWGLGTVFVSQIPFYVGSYFTTNSDLVTWFLAAFTIGIATGAFGCAAILRGHITDKTVLPGALGMTLFGIGFWVSSAHPHPGAFPVAIVLELFAIAVSAGMFVVPLYTMLQHQADERTRGRMVASSNIFNALVMTTMSLLTAFLLQTDLTITDILTGWAVLTLLIYVAAKFKA